MLIVLSEDPAEKADCKTGNHEHELELGTSLPNIV